MAQKKDICKVKLDYPCQWLYKVIGTDKEQLRHAIKEVIKTIPSEINLSNSTSSGKYLCLNLEITVQSEEERNSIYQGLKDHPNIKIVL
jgi:putative lipoic acid-binding regulatory protein